MAKQNRMERVGLVGWRRYEPLILAAIVADLPIMLTGAPGTGKTTGAAAIVRGLYGNEASFKAYPCPELHPDSFAGYVNIPKLNEGEIEYVTDDLTVWGKTAILLDEPNRAPQMLQHALMEFVRTRRYRGRDTGVQLVFSAMNPPDLDPTTTYLSPPNATRYVYCWAPGLEEFVNEAEGLVSTAFGAALFSDLDKKVGDETDSTVLASALQARELMREMNGDIYKEGWIDSGSMINAIEEVAGRLRREYSVSWSVRQAQYLRRLVEGLVCLYAVDRDFDYGSPADLGILVHATVPEFYGAIPSRIGNVLQGAVLPDNFLRIFGDLMAPTMHNKKAIHVNLAGTIRDGVKRSKKRNFDVTAWAMEVLDSMERASEDHLNSDVNDAMSALNSSQVPDDVTAVIVNRYRLRRMAISRPKLPLLSRHLDSIIRRGRRPKAKLRRGEDTHRAELTKEAYTRIPQALNHPGFEANNRGLWVPSIEDEEDAAGYADGTYTFPVATRGTELDHNARALLLLGEHSGRTLVFVDPLGPNEDERVMVVTYTLGVGNRVMRPSIRYVPWDKYKSLGLAADILTPTTDVLGVILNPTWEDAERSRISSCLAHGLETHLVLDDDLDII